MKPSAKKKSRRVQPENWADVYSYALALRRFAKSHDPNEFNEMHIPHEGMADVLTAIAFGADASEVFRQNAAPHRQSLKIFNRTRAFAYWQSRIIDKKTHAEAVRVAQDHFPDLPQVSAATITRLANTYQKEALTRFERGGLDVAHVRAEIAARSKRGNW